MANNISIFDKLITEKVMNISFAKKFKTYQEIAIELNVSENFIKQVFTFRSKFNLYHLYKLSILLNTNVSNFLPTVKELKENLKQKELMNLIDQEILEVINPNE